MERVVSYNELFDEAATDLEAKFSKEYPKGISAEMVDYSKSNDDMERLALISFTSGTSSAPKGVMLPVRSLSSNMRFAHAAIPAHPGGHILSILPLAHMFGMTFDFLYPLTIGGKITMLTQKPTPARLLAALAEVKPFMFLTVPMVIEKVFKSKVIPMLKKPAMRVALAIPGLNRIILKAVRDKLYKTFGGNLLHGVIIGGAALSKEVEDWMKKMKFPYCVGYGMTECAPIITYDDWAVEKLYSCGKTVPNMEIMIASPDPQNIPGEIRVKGANVFLGYFKNEEATKEVFTEDGWFRTGDMGVIDQDGCLFIKGRSKCMILGPSGQNIYPEEVEVVINSQPYVVDSLVVEDNGGLTALIYPDFAQGAKEGMNQKAFAKFIEDTLPELNKELPNYARLKKIVVMTEDFERTPKKSIKRYLYQRN